MRLDCSAKAGRKPSPSVRLMTAGSGSLDSGRTSRASLTPSGVRISRFCSIIFALKPGVKRFFRTHILLLANILLESAADPAPRGRYAAHHHHRAAGTVGPRILWLRT